jgi:hypothetical protein
MSHNQLEVGVYLVLILVILGLLYGQAARADSQYCNKMGDTVVCNSYNSNGTMESTYYNQYGDTTVGNNYDRDNKERDY